MVYYNPQGFHVESHSEIPAGPLVERNNPEIPEHLAQSAVATAEVAFQSGVFTASEEVGATHSRSSTVSSLDFRTSTSSSENPPEINASSRLQDFKDKVIKKIPEFGMLIDKIINIRGLKAILDILEIRKQSSSTKELINEARNLRDELIIDKFYEIYNNNNRLSDSEIEKISHFIMDLHESDSPHKLSCIYHSFARIVTEYEQRSAQDHEHFAPILDEMRSLIVKEEEKPNYPKIIKLMSNLVSSVSDSEAEYSKLYYLIATQEKSLSPSDFYHIEKYIGYLQASDDPKKAERLEFLNSIVEEKDTRIEFVRNRVFDVLSKSDVPGYLRAEIIDYLDRGLIEKTYLNELSTLEQDQLVSAIEDYRACLENSEGVKQDFFSHADPEILYLEAVKIIHDANGSKWSYSDLKVVIATIRVLKEINPVANSKCIEYLSSYLPSEVRQGKDPIGLQAAVQGPMRQFFRLSESLESTAISFPERELFMQGLPKKENLENLKEKVFDQLKTSSGSKDEKTLLKMLEQVNIALRILDQRSKYSENAIPQHHTEVHAFKVGEDIFFNSIHVRKEEDFSIGQQTISQVNGSQITLARHSAIVDEKQMLHLVHDQLLNHLDTVHDEQFHLVEAMYGQSSQSYARQIFAEFDGKEILFVDPRSDRAFTSDENFLFLPAVPGVKIGEALTLHTYIIEMDVRDNRDILSRIQNDFPLINEKDSAVSAFAKLEGRVALSVSSKDGLKKVDQFATAVFKKTMERAGGDKEISDTVSSKLFSKTGIPARLSANLRFFPRAKMSVSMQIRTKLFNQVGHSSLKAEQQTSSHSFKASIL